MIDKFFRQYSREYALYSTARRFEQLTSGFEELNRQLQSIDWQATERYWQELNRSIRHDAAKSLRTATRRRRARYWELRKARFPPLDAIAGSHQPRIVFNIRQAYSRLKLR